jgi:hypothetical protein
MLQRIEATAAQLRAWRWAFFAGWVLGFVNGGVLLLTDLRVHGALGFHYFMISFISSWISLGALSLIHWFAPGRGDDPRPLVRRLYRIAVAYALISTAIPLGLAAFGIYAYASMSARVYRPSAVELPARR